MRSILGFAFAAGLAMMSGMTVAQAAACTFAEWGHSYFRAELQNETWTYVLKVSGGKWRNAPYGYHAPGHLSCEDCSPGVNRAGGLYYFIAQASLDAMTLKPPTTAAARAERRRENWGYPSSSLGPDDLLHQRSWEHVALGPLSGYAVFYRVTGRNAGNSDRVFMPDSDHLGLLVLYLTDGCVSFEISLLNDLSGNGDFASLLDIFLTDVSVEKVRGVRGADRAIVRPRPEGEEPVFLHKLRPPPLEKQ